MQGRKRLKVEHAESDELLPSQSTVAPSLSQENLAVKFEDRLNLKKRDRQDETDILICNEMAPVKEENQKIKEIWATTDASTLLDFVKDERNWEAIAATMRDLVGLTLDEQNPRGSMDTFFIRYTALPDKRDNYYFKYIKKEPVGAVVAQLITTSFYDMVFEGDAMRTPLQSERSACRKFIQDPAVLEAAHLLPPQMLHIKNRVNLLAKQKQALREQGYDPKELQREMENKLYLAFRSLGCRTAMWDGNL